MKPLALDLCCGLGGWAHGLLAEGWDVIGFDIERHEYGGERYPAQLVLQDIRTLDGTRFRGRVSLIVASPPCTEFSYMAMPWTRGKQIANALRGKGEFPKGYRGSRTVAQLTELFDACVRIGKEVGCPAIIENVRGAQPWVGKARWNFGSYFLYGDVPALMPITQPRRESKVGSWDPTRANFIPSGKKDWDVEGTKMGPSPGNLWSGRPPSVAAHRENGGYKSQGMNWSDRSKHGQDFTRVAGRQAEGMKTIGHANKRDGYSHTRHLTNQIEHDLCENKAVPQPGLNAPIAASSIARSTVATRPNRNAPAHQSTSEIATRTLPEEGTKQSGICGLRNNGKGDKWFQDGAARSSSKSNARKAASAMIAKIPLTLARWIAKTYYPR